jgi:hypothetical protein
LSFLSEVFIKIFQNKNKNEWISVSKKWNVYYNPSKIFHIQNGKVRMLIKLTGEKIEMKQ